jgi:hypothetical protein
MMLHARACPPPVSGGGRTLWAQLPVTVTVPVLLVAWMTGEEAAARGTDTRTEPVWVLAVTRYAVPDGTRMATEPIAELAKICRGGAVNPALPRTSAAPPSAAQPPARWSRSAAVLLGSPHSSTNPLASPWSKVSPVS